MSFIAKNAFKKGIEGGGFSFNLLSNLILLSKPFN